MVRGDMFASRDIRANDRARQQVSDLFSLRTKQNYTHFLVIPPFDVVIGKDLRKHAYVNERISSMQEA